MHVRLLPCLVLSLCLAACSDAAPQAGGIPFVPTGGEDEPDAPAGPGEGDSDPLPADPESDAGEKGPVDGGAPDQPDGPDDPDQPDIPQPEVPEVAGPGLGQVDCDGDEFEVVARFGDDLPDRPGSLLDPLSLVKGYGLNVVYMHNGYLVVLYAPDSGTGPGGLRFYDVSDPRNPRLVHDLYEPEGRTREFREAHSIGFSSFDGVDYAVFHSGKGLEFWDLSDVRDPHPVGKIVLPGVDFGDYTSVSWQLVWQGRYVYVASSNQGIFIVDALNPSAPVLVDRGPGKPNPVPISQLGGFRVGPIFAVGNTLVVSSMDTERGYAVLDIGDPRNPVLQSALNRGLQKFYAIVFNGNKIIGSVRGPGAAMTVHDITDPSKIVLEDDTLVIDEQLYASTQDQFVFQGCQEEVVKVDISTPGDYRIVGRGGLRLQLGLIAQQVGPDHGQVTPMGNLVFVGNDHGTGSGMLCHQSAPDTTAPRVNMVSPAPDAQLQADTSRVGLTFTDNVQVHSINDTTFLVREVGTTEVLPGRYAVQGAMVNFSPAQPLKPNTQYEVIVPAAGVRDWAGNATDELFTSRFWTAPALEPSPLAEGLVAHWRLDEGSGDVALDVSGNGNHGAVEGGAFWSEGALAFEQDADTVHVTGDGPDIDGDLSVALWVRTDAPAEAGGDTPRNWARGGWLLDKRQGTRGRGWALSHHHGKAKFFVNDDAQTLVSTRRIDDGQWHHIAAVRRDDGSRALYVDGALEQQADGGSTASVSHTEDLYIGSRDGEGNSARAHLRDVMLFDRALADADVVEAMNGLGQLSVQLQPLAPSLVGEAVTLRAVTSGQGTRQLSFQLGDGTTTPFSASEELTHTFDAPGHYEVIVTVTDGARTAGATLLHTVHWPLTDARPTRSSTVAHDDATGLVWNVNPDNDTVTAIDGRSLEKVAEVGVGRHPRTLAVDPAGRIWVANQDDATLSVLGASDGQLQRTVSLPRASRPYGVAVDPAGSFVYVSLQGSAEVLKLRAGDAEVVDSAQVQPDPRGVAVSADGSRLLVTRLRSPSTQGVVSDIRTSDMALTQALEVTLDSTTVDGEDRGRGLPNYLGSVTISPDGRSAWVPSKSDNILRGVFRDGLRLNHENSVRAITSRLDLLNDRELVTARIDFNDREMPVAVEMSPLGDYAYIALQGSGKVDIRDGYTGLPVGTIDDTGLAPQGVALTADGSRLFVHNFMSRTVVAYDTQGLVDATGFAPALLGTVSTVANENLSPTVLLGKQIFYNGGDRRMSRDGYISCASCHLDGDQDGRVWDFTGRGEGLRNTISLIGRAGTGHGPVHWTANFDEIQDFENDIRGGFGGTGLMSDAHFAETRDTLGAPKAGRSEDLDALAAYVTSLDEFPQSPYRAQDGSLTAQAQTGQALFAQLECDSCHGGPEFTDSAAGVRHDVGTAGAGSGGRLGGAYDGFDTPTLRGLWDSAPYLHDGSAQSVRDVLTHPGDGNARHVPELSDAQLDALTAYLLQVE